MTASIQLKHRGVILHPNEGETILECALRHHVRLPSSCRNGTCRSCLCKIETGEVVYRIEWPGLSQDEIQDGYILPCVAIAATDLIVLDED